MIYIYNIWYTYIIYDIYIWYIYIYDIYIYIYDIYIYILYIWYVYIYMIYIWCIYIYDIYIWYTYDIYIKGLRPLPPTPRPLEAGKCLTLLSEATRKALGKRPECCKSLRRRRRGAFEARLLPPECSKSLWQGRREAFGGRQVPNVAFWSH